MAADGTTVMRMYPFEPDTSLTYNTYNIAAYTEQATVDNTAYNNGAPDPKSAVYPGLDVGIWAIEDRQTGYDAGTNLRSFVTIVNDYNGTVPSGTEYVEVEFIPVVNGVVTPIDIFDPPADLFLFINGHYAGGVVEIGGYVGGQYVVMGAEEFSDYNGFYGFGESTVALTAAAAPSIPAFWTGFVNARESVGG